jgi:hypothetical protein
MYIRRLFDWIRMCFAGIRMFLKNIQCFFPKLSAPGVLKTVRFDMLYLSVRNWNADDADIAGLGMGTLMTRI